MHVAKRLNFSFAFLLLCGSMPNVVCAASAEESFLKLVIVAGCNYELPKQPVHTKGWKDTAWTIITGAMVAAGAQFLYNIVSDLYYAKENAESKQRQKDSTDAINKSTEVEYQRLLFDKQKYFEVEREKAQLQNNKEHLALFKENKKIEEEYYFNDPEIKELNRQNALSLMRLTGQLEKKKYNFKQQRGSI